MQHKTVRSIVNKDATSSNCSDCGNRHHLEDNSGNLLHASNATPSTATTSQYLLPASSIDNDTAELHFVRDQGYRVALSEVLIVEQGTLDTQEPSISITSPAINTYLSNGKVWVTGSSTAASTAFNTIEVGIRVKSSAAQFIWQPITQLQSEGGWSYLWTLPQDGEYELKAKIKNLTSDAESSVVTVTVDQTAPEPVGYAVGTDVANDDGSSISIEWESSSSSDVQGYRIERRQGSNGYALISEVNSELTQIEDDQVTAGTAYEYRVFSKDKAGNYSAATYTGEVIAKDNSADNQAPEDVTGLQAVIGDGEVYLSWIGSVDTAQDLVGYYLDISTNDGVSWGSQSPNFNDGNALELNKQALNHLVSGLSNGQVYRFRIRAYDGAGNISAGAISTAITPTLNAVTQVSGTLSENTSWRTGVYYINGNVTIPEGKTLTIYPGVIVKVGAQRSITVKGKLEGLGTEVNPVHITAYTDDSVGGDSNGDGSATQPVAGYWRRLFIDDNAELTLAHTKVRYGGQAYDNAIYSEYRSSVALKNSEISNSKGTGVYSIYANLNIENSFIHNNSGNGISATGGSYETNAILKNNTISDNGNNGFAVTSTTYAVELTGNRFENNGKYGIYSDNKPRSFILKNNSIISNTSAARIPFSALPSIDDNNEFAGNHNQDIELIGADLQRNVKTDANLTYRIVSGTAKVKAGSLLNIPAGSVWKFDYGTSIQVDGALNAVGSSNARIYFTSFRDDSVGGDTNQDGYSQGQAGDWSGLYFTDTVADNLTKLAYIENRFAGRSSTAAIRLYNASISITDSLIRDSAYRGLQLYGSNSIIERNEIVDTQEGTGIWIENYSNPLIKNNRIAYSGTNGIRVESSTSAPELIDNLIEHNKSWGIYFRYAVNGPVLQGNTIIHNQRPMAIPVRMMPNEADANTLIPNEYNAIHLRGQSLNRDLTLDVISEEGAQISSYLV
ncbi:right-handed parallel beta-helix repeat-containing protein, partial [Shewanella sp. 202IG2-18]|uniref:right-handed parallel beta-helix repeat-containing protein n=1 Tax=Parashewanella hymeniacidonis TaxID=2807618 RepID=UPI0019613429